MFEELEEVRRLLIWDFFLLVLGGRVCVDEKCLNTSTS